jgi:hypothetical protein
MTPKEKAIHLCDMFYQKLPLERYVITTDGDLSWEYNNWKTTKECALIMVDEIIDAIDWHEFEHPNKEFDYWYEVKTEIEKL